MTYKHSGKWDVGASGLLGGTHISLRPPCRSRTSRTPEWAPGTPHIASAAAVVAHRGAARIGVALQAGAGHRSQAKGDGAVGREPARARAVQGVRLDRAGHGLSVSAAARARVAAIRAGVS